MDKINQAQQLYMALITKTCKNDEEFERLELQLAQLADDLVSENHPLADLPVFYLECIQTFKKTGKWNFG